VGAYDDRKHLHETMYEESRGSVGRPASRHQTPRQSVVCALAEGSQSYRRPNLVGDLLT